MIASSDDPFFLATAACSFIRVCEEDDEKSNVLPSFTAAPSAHVRADFPCVPSLTDLGRVGGGYKVIVRNRAYPRPAALVAAQILMLLGHLYFMTNWPGAMHIGTLLIGLGYGAHWSIIPAAASELFGLKNFGALYNFFIVANPTGSLIFSGIIACSMYYYEVEKQAHMHINSPSLFGTILGVANLSEEKALKCEGTICFFLSSLLMLGFYVVATILSLLLLYRTKVVYANVYGNRCPMLEIERKISSYAEEDGRRRMDRGAGGR
ncbi:uncharacterized protein LOC141833159 [Curcuma longa]|uniref:uncharacterized protein LOC141833159 n=1 Tax=Curcuma longa TaxID=136217 RepID=UPI003D9F97BF